MKFPFPATHKGNRYTAHMDDVWTAAKAYAQANGHEYNSSVVQGIAPL